MQINGRMAALLLTVVAGEYVAMRWMAQTWIAGSEEARATRDAPPSTNVATPPATNTAAPAPAAVSTANWNASGGGWGGQQDAVATSNTGGAPAVAGLSAAGGSAQASVSAAAPQAFGGSSMPGASSELINTSRNAGP